MKVTDLAGWFNEQGKAFIEQGEGIMCKTYKECIAQPQGPTTVLLNLSSGLMRYYPAFLKLSMWLNRLVQ